MSNNWNAKVYSQFLDLRTRPARDLLAVIPSTFQPEIVYDLGCGPGNSTILLKERWPDAKIIGLDSSFDMLSEARSCFPEIDFVHGDIADFSPAEKINCLFANASLQWLTDHENLLPKLLKFIKPDGIFAIQMPNNFHSPTHQVTIQILHENAAWQHLLKNLNYGILAEPLYKLSWYYDLFIKAGVKQVQLWETKYFQEMTNYEEIFNWVKGTGLRPVLNDMNNEQQLLFRDAYLKAIAKKYSSQANGKILMPFRRVFIIAFC